MQRAKCWCFVCYCTWCHRRFMDPGPSSSSRAQCSLSVGGWQDSGLSIGHSLLLTTLTLLSGHSEVRASSHSRGFPSDYLRGVSPRRGCLQAGGPAPPPPALLGPAASCSHQGGLLACGGMVALPSPGGEAGWSRPSQEMGDSVQRLA